MAATGRLERLLPACACIAVLASLSIGASTHGAGADGRRMSFDNRVLLNRAVVSGVRTLEVLTLAREAGPEGTGKQLDQIEARLATLGGRAKRIERPIGYMRVEVPTERFVELVDSPAIDAYRIASLSRGAWYRDAPPFSNADMFRDYEVTPIAATEPAVTHADLPLLTPAEARAPGFTARDAGLRRS